MGEEKEKESIIRTVNDCPDSIEIGTPARGGAIKAYGNFLDIDSFRKKIDNACAVREYAKSRLGGE